LFLHLLQDCRSKATLGGLSPSDATAPEEELFVSDGELDVLERQLEARDPDVRLMLQVRDDQPSAFESLVGRYQDRLVGILFHLVGSLDEAEDLERRTVGWRAI
jgi:hypothetical protein